MNLMKGVGVAAIIALTACSTTPGRTDAELRALLDRFIHAVNVADTDNFVACFAPDATAFFPSNASAARRTGIAEIRNAVAPVFAQGPRTPAARLGDLVITQQDEFAVASFDAGSGTMHARRTVVLRKIEGQWRIVHLHASNVAEP
jgi:uncharacterized protein (TIGR02246 family)